MLDGWLEIQFRTRVLNGIYDFQISFIHSFVRSFMQVDNAFSPTIGYGESLVVLSAIPVIWLLFTLLLFLIFFCVRCCQACIKAR